MAQDTRCTHLQCVGGPQYRHCALRPSRPPAARRGAWMLLHRSGTPGSERVCGRRDGLGVGVGRNSQVGVLAFRIEARAGFGNFREVPVALDDRALVLRLEAAKELLEGVLLLWCAGVLRVTIAVDPADKTQADRRAVRSEEHTSDLQSLMRISYAVFCLK